MIPLPAALGPLAFIDTNVLLYAYDRTDAAKQRVVENLIVDLIASETLILSAQVLNELYRNLTNPQKKSGRPTFSHADALVIVNLMINNARRIVPVTAEVCLQGYTIANRHRMQLWDALLLSAAIEGGATLFYTEDLPAAVDKTTGLLEGLRYVNPFAAPPSMP